MGRIVAFAVLLVLFLCAQVFAEPLTTEFLEQKSEEARIMLKKSKLAKGEILLAVYSAKRDATDTVRLKVASKQPRDPKKFSFSLLTDGYKVEHLRGQGVTRLAFKVSKNGEEMVLLDARYFLKSMKEAVSYFPYTDVFLREENISDGAEYLFSKIREAQDELRKLGVPSRAYPEKLLANVFQDELIANLAFIEQIDDKEFAFDCPNPESLPEENRIYENCAEYAVYKALTHIARNREEAFSRSVSRTGARGIMQFMNSRRVPTYRLVVKFCEKAKIIKDFMAGAANIKNSFKASICLLDFFLTNFPEGIREEFVLNPRVGGIFPVAAYNGGPRAAEKLYRILFGKEKKLDIAEDFRAPRNVLKKETAGYLSKYFAVWGIIDRLKEE